MSQRRTAVIAGMLLLLGAGIVAAEDPSQFAVWIVKADNEWGTAFVVDDRGYLITASHVVKRSDGQYRSSIKVALPGDAEYTADVVGQSDLCKVVTDEKLCRHGHDLVLLKANGFPVGQYPALDLDLTGRVPQSFKGSAYGYSDKSVGLAPSGMGSFQLQSARIKYPDRFEKGSDKFFEASLGVHPGYSGGPIMVPQDEGGKVVAVTSWISTFIAEMPSIVTYGTPSDRAYAIIGLIKSGSTVNQLSRWIRGGLIRENILRGVHLPRLRTIELIHLVRDLFGQDPATHPASGYTRAIWEECLARNLGREVLALTELIPPGDYAVLREGARASLELATAAMRLGDTNEGIRLASEASKRYTYFLVNGSSAKPDWLGKKVVAAAAFDASRAAVIAGDPDSSLGWMAVAYKATGDPGATLSLADALYRRNDYEGSAILFADVFRKGIERHHANKGFRESILNLKRIDPGSIVSTTADTHGVSIFTNPDIDKQINGKIKMLFDSTQREVLKNLKLD